MKNFRSLRLVRHVALLFGVLSLLATGIVPHHHHGRVPCVVREACHAGHAAAASHTAHCPHRTTTSHGVCSAHVQYVRAATVVLDDGSPASPAPWDAACWLSALAVLRTELSSGGRHIPLLPVTPLPPGAFPSGGWRAPPQVC